MTDSGRPERRTLCFLSTLLSQNVPEKSDVMLRCIISGQPKPEVTWYKNGQAIDDCGIVSCYEFFENQYIHLLHLSRCTPNDAAVYQISAKNCFGMICCSASVEVKVSEHSQLSPVLEDDRDTGWKHETGWTYEEESANQLDEKESPHKETESTFLATPTAAGSSPTKSIHSRSTQLLADNDIRASSSDNPLDVERTKQTEEAHDPGNTEEIADGLLFLKSNNTPPNQDVCGPGTVNSQLSRFMDDSLSNDGPNDEVLNANHQNPKVQKYISLSLPLSEATAHIYPGDGATVNKQHGPQVSSEDSDSDYELCPEITLTYTEEFSDDDLEYLECSDVMTDYSNAVWQRNLQGTEHVFLLESDAEEMESSECCLGGCEHLLSGMGCGPRVSGDIRPMDATSGFCGYHSQPQQVGVRRGRASTLSPTFPQTEMTLTLGPHQDGTSVVTEQGRYKLPTASEAAENDYPGIQGENRDRPQTREEFSSDNQLNMDEAVAETETKPLSSELEKSGMNQCSETTAEKRGEEKEVWSKRGSQKPARVRRLGIKGKAKKLSPSLKERAADGSLPPCCPREPAKRPLTRTDERGISHGRAEATDWNSHFPAGGCAISNHTEQEANPLQTPTDSVPKEGNAHFEGEGMWVNNLFETSQVPDLTDHPQVQIQEMVRERSQMPAFSEPAGEEFPFTGTTANSFPSLGGIQQENTSLDHSLQVEGCVQGPQHKEKQDREGNTPEDFWEGLKHELSYPGPSEETMSPGAISGHPPQGASTDLREPAAPSVAAPEPIDADITLEDEHDGPRGREAVCVTECPEADGQGTCDAMESPGGVPTDKYLPQEICSMDFELAGGHSEVSDLCSPDAKTLVLFQTQGAECPQSPCGGSEDGNSAGSPLFVSTFTWNISRQASDGESLADGENSCFTLASTVQAGQERPSPGNSTGPEEIQLLSSESSSFMPSKDGGDRSPSTIATDTTDMPASHRSTVKFPQETPTLTTDIECLQVTRETEDPSTISIATNVHPAKYLAVSIAESKPAGGAEESVPQTPDEKIPQSPSSVQWGHILSGSTTKSTKELLCMVPRVPGVCGHVPWPLEEEGSCDIPPLQVDDLFGRKSQTVDRADNRSLDENFPERGEMEQRAQQDGLPPWGSVSAPESQGSWLTTFAAHEEINLMPSGHSPASSREEMGQNSGVGTCVSRVADVTVGEDSQTLSKVPPPLNVPQEEAEAAGPGAGEAGDKLKGLTLEDSGSDIWPPRQMTNSEGKELESGPIIPARPWAAPHILEANASAPGLGPSEMAASPHSPLEADSALADGGEPRKDPAIRAHWTSLCSQDLSQTRLQESSVDPVDEQEFSVCAADAPSGASEENAHSASQDQRENQVTGAHPAFLVQLLTCSHLLESSVDPTDEGGAAEGTRTNEPQPSQSPLGGISEGSKPNGRNWGRRLEVQPVGRCVLHPGEEGERIPSGCSLSQVQEGSDRSLAAAGLSNKDKAELIPPASALSSCAAMTHASVGVNTQDSTGQGLAVPENDLDKPRNHPHVLSDSKERGPIENECGKHFTSSTDLTKSPHTSPPGGNIINFSISHRIEDAKMKEPQIGETEPSGSSGPPAVTLAPTSREWESDKAHPLLQDPRPKATLGCVNKPRGAQTSKFSGARPIRTGSEEVRKKQETSGTGHLAEGVKKKILSRVAALRLRLEEKENVRKNSSFLKKMPKLERSSSHTDEKKDPKKPSCKREGKAPVLLKKIQAEMFPDHSGNIKLSCQFAEIHEDSTILWTKDSKSIAQVQRSAGDNSTVSFAIIQASQKDQGLYYCCINNSYGKVTAEFNLTAEVLKQLSSYQDIKGYEEIEFSQLMFKEDFLNDRYFGDRLRGQIATEELHFGEGIHRKAFRSRVMRGLAPVFKPGHACVLKVHNAVAHGTRSNDELIQRNYRLAVQECYVQNTARYYAKIYAAEAQPLEGFGEVPEIIPIFLIYRPENNIPYATVEEELIGEFVKYSIRDGKEINFLRRESEAGQKCCTFQHWVYQKTSGCLLVTDMQGVGMKLTDVGIATLAKGYKGFKGNCSMTFIDQFKALHQCNKYCKMLGLKSLQNSNQKQKKPNPGKSKVQTNSIAVKKTESGTPAEKKT
ncbi:alpha-protein kinase 2 [Otolemur garnettii]|uniref:Alpha-protein kinase 2 n=1 Tax=Otolemur garnettii TaxID=30611 RepID=H0XDP3_OTOGA|nr:alpha-protein kinase 2 [Otolemur garnettii]